MENRYRNVEVEVSKIERSFLDDISGEASLSRTLQVSSSFKRMLQKSGQVSTLFAAILIGSLPAKIGANTSVSEPFVISPLNDESIMQMQSGIYRLASDAVASVIFSSEDVRKLAFDADFQSSIYKSASKSFGSEIYVDHSVFIQTGDLKYFEKPFLEMDFSNSEIKQFSSSLLFEERLKEGVDRGKESGKASHPSSAVAAIIKTANKYELPREKIQMLISAAIRIKIEEQNKERLSLSDKENCLESIKTLYLLKRYSQGADGVFMTLKGKEVDDFSNQFTELSKPVSEFDLAKDLTGSYTSLRGAFVEMSNKETGELAIPNSEEWVDKVNNNVSVISSVFSKRNLRRSGWL